MTNKLSWSVLENIAEGYYETDLRGTYHFCNEAYSNILGVPKEKIIGSNYKKFLSEGAESIYQIFHTVYLTGNPATSAHRKVTRPDGSQRDMEYSVSLIKDEKDLPIGFQGIARDITEQRQMEETIRQSEERYRTILENIEDGYHEVDLKGNFTLFNESFRKIMGYTKEELLGMNYKQYANPENVQKVLKAYDQVYRTGEPLKRFEWTVIRKDGARRDLAVSVSLIKDASNQATGFRGIIRDETDRKEAEEALRLSEEKLSKAFRACPDWMTISTLDEGRYIDVNDAFLSMTGYTREQVIGHTSQELGLWVNPQDRTKAIQIIQKVGSIRNFESAFRMKSGEIRVVLRSSEIILLGEEKCIVSVNRDITRLRQAEAEKTKLESQLRQAQKMEAIGTLAGGIAHDFNNILTVIIGCTDLALVDIPKEHPVCEHLMLVREAGTRATDLVKQILAFSRQVEQEQKPIRLGSIVKEALKMLRSSLPSTIQIRQTIEENHGLIMADPTQIHQILINLCTNAAHAMRENGGVLEIRLTNVRVETGSSGKFPDLSPGPYVNLTVSDTGHGMKPEIMDRIFDPYFTTKAVGEGAGLGLAVVYGIVKSYHGAVKVHSKPGKGSIFEVFLPRIEYPPQETKAMESEPIPGGSERILLVDDEEALVYAVQKMLERLGYRVTAKTSSLEALETFYARPREFDLIITDMTMPNMTGVELSKRIKQMRPDIPMVLCTGFSEMIDEKKAEALGFEAFVMKPIVRRNIAETTRKVLDRKNDE